MGMNAAPPMPEPSLIVRVPEAARLLEVSESTIWAWGSNKSSRRIAEFPQIFAIGKGASGIFRKELEEFLAAQWAKAVEKDATRTSIE